MNKSWTIYQKDHECVYDHNFDGFLVDRFWRLFEPQGIIEIITDFGIDFKMRKKRIGNCAKSSRNLKTSLDEQGQQRTQKCLHLGS